MKKLIIIPILFLLISSVFAQSDTIDVFSTDTVYLCPSDTISLSAESNGTANSTYSWSNSDTNSVTTVTTVGNYVVTVTDGSTVLQDSVIVLLDSYINFTINPTLDLCESDNFPLHIYDSSGYWYGPFIQNNIFYTDSAGGTGTYQAYFYFPSVGGCYLDTNLVNITINPVPEITFASDTITYCNTNQNILLDSSLYSPNSGFWSGNGIVHNSGVFNPHLAGGLGVLGNDSIYPVAYFVSTPHCSDNDTLFIKVTYGDTLQVIQNEIGMCRFDGLDTLSKYINVSNSTGITWSGNGIINSSLGIFDPQLSNVDTVFQNVITVTQGQGSCQKSDIIMVRVGLPPVVNAGNDFSVCVNMGIDTLKDYVPYTHWTGAGIIDTTLGVFNPQVAGVGLHVLTYHWLNPITNCYVSDDLTVNVLPIPNVNVTPSIDTLCNQENILLSDYFSITPNGVGGTWLGAGISAPAQGILSPNSVTAGGFGAGDYNLSYVFVDNNLCSDTTSVVLTITDGAFVSAGLDTSVCINDGPFTLQGYPAGGLWSSELQGLISPVQAIYDPFLIGGGSTDTLVYTYDDGFCINRDTVLLNINNNPTVYVNFNDTVCANEGNYTLSGNYPIANGFWLGSGGILNSVTGLYNPSITLSNIDSLYYYYVDPNTGCSNTALKVITIDSVPDVSINNIPSFYFRDQAAIPISGIPSDGIFYSNQTGLSFGNSNYFFNPQSTVTNYQKIYFTYTDDNGCSDIDSQSINIADRFVTVNNGINGLSFSSLDWGDYDNDGDLDLIMLGNGISGIKTLLYQNSNGSFTTNSFLNNLLVKVEKGDVKWGDYDNDGDLDILISGRVANSPNATLKIYENRVNTNGDFIEDVQANSQLVGVENSTLDWSDLDNDGDLDILAIGTNSSGVASSMIYINKMNENGSFIPSSNSLVPVQNGDISIGDFDNDADMDIILTGYSAANNSAVTTLYKNDGTGQFAIQPTSISPLRDSDVAFGDYDNDGDLDVLIAGNNALSSDVVTEIYENTGGNFSNVTIGISILEGVEKGKVAWGDYDNDGDLDLTLIGKRNITDAGYASILRNNHGDSLPLYQPLIPILDPLYGGDITWVDFDNDGDLDICQIGSQGNTSNNFFRIFENQNELSSSPNTPPSAPNNIVDTVYLENGSVELSWSNSFDNTTPALSLSYNLSVGRTLSSVESVTPMSDISTGKRQVIRRGNVGKNTFTTLRNLPEGKHFWKVQAIDNNYDGGAFSIIDSFDIRRILIDSVQEVLCAGATTDLYYSTIATGFFDSTNIFNVEMSDLSGSFSNPVLIGSSNSDTSGVVSISIPEGTQGGAYKIRMTANQPFSESLNYPLDIIVHPVSGFDLQTNDSLFCEGNSTILTTSYVNNFSYQWKENDVLLVAAIDTFLQVFDTAQYKVIITTNHGCIDSASISTGFYADPVPSFTINDSCRYTSVQPVNNSVIPQGLISEYRWNFGDSLGYDIGFEPTHIYNWVDTFTIKLITESDKGCLDSTTQEIVVHPLPFANFTADDICFGGDSLVFYNTSGLPTYGTIDFFYWDFDDGNTNTVENPKHYYHTSDTFYVNLIAESDYGCIDDTTQKVVIHPLPLPSFNALRSCQRDIVQFQDLSQAILVPYDSTIWTFDDGYSSYLPSPTHTYNIADTFDVNLKLVTPFGCEADTTIPLIIDPVPESGFYAVGNCIEDFSIQFYDTSTIKSGMITDYYWDFGDDIGLSNFRDPLYTYSSDSVYTVTLITESEQDCRDTIMVNNPSLLLPIADFTFWKNPISLGDTLRPINNSEFGFSYYWDFGDTTNLTGGDTSIIESPKYFYNNFGSYTISLFVYNELGCPDSTSRIVKVQPRPRSDYEVITYPNPTYDGFVTLNIDLREPSDLNVEVFNVVGQKVWSLAPNGESVRAIPPPDPYDVYKVDIDISNQSSGYYFLSIIVDGVRYSTTNTVDNGPLRGRDLDYNHSMKILLIK